MRTPSRLLFAALLCACATSTASSTATPGNSAAAPADAAAGKEFLARTNKELYRLSIKGSTARWIKSTYITGDTERMGAQTSDERPAVLGAAAKAAVRFKAVPGIGT